jgi:hypothetical protein
MEIKDDQIRESNCKNKIDELKKHIDALLKLLHEKNKTINQLRKAARGGKR